jgi:signal transduction histidine kinase
VSEIVTQIWDRDGVLVYWSRPGAGFPGPATEGYSNVEAQTAANGASTRTSKARTRCRSRIAMDERQKIATEVALRTLLPLAALIPVLGALIWYAVGAACAPLDRMSRAVAKRRPDAMAPLARATCRGAAPLADSLNALLARLDEALSAQRRFTADAAHELRTPLAALKLQVGLAKRAQDDAQRASAMASSRRAWTARRISSTSSSRWRASSPTRPIGATSPSTCGAREGGDRRARSAGRRQAHRPRPDGRLERDGARRSRDARHADRQPARQRASLHAARRPHRRRDRRRRRTSLSVIDTGPASPARIASACSSGSTGARRETRREPEAASGLSIVRRIANAHGAAVALGDGSDGRGLPCTCGFLRRPQRIHSWVCPKPARRATS